MAGERLVGLERDFFQPRHAVDRTFCIADPDQVLGQAAGTENKVMISAGDDYGIDPQRAQARGNRAVKATDLVVSLAADRVGLDEHERRVRHDEAADIRIGSRCLGLGYRNLCAPNPTGARQASVKFPDRTQYPELLREELVRLCYPKTADFEPRP
jgi:hypothetical protein